MYLFFYKMATIRKIGIVQTEGERDVGVFHCSTIECLNYNMVVVL